MAYGCFNRAPFVESQTVHGISRDTGLPVSTTIPFRMSRDCNYARFDRYADPGCVGCAERDKALAFQKVSPDQVVTA